MKKLLIIVFLLSILNDILAQNRITYELESSMSGITTLWNGNSLNFWGFKDIGNEARDVYLPSPTIICNEGDTVVLILTNPSFEAHTIHPHGLDVDQINDGVPSTSFFVQPGQTGTYSFVATYAGNFLYHCHVGSVLHLQMGMYGAIIVKANSGTNQVYTGGPTYNKEHYFLTNEVDKSWHDDYTSIGSFINYFPDFFHINGKSRQQIWNDSSISIYDAKIGEVILLRLMNMGYGINEYIFPSSLNANVVTSDGRPLPSSFSSDTIRVAPGERYSVLIRPTVFMQDSITVNYLKMYRNKLDGTEKIPISVNGVYGIESANREDFNIFPNPSTDEFIVTTKSDGRILLYNLESKLIFDGPILAREKKKLIIEKEGMYIIKVISQNGHSSERKLIKK